MSSINTQSKVKLFYQSKISLWLKSRAAPARNYYDKTSWESLHCCTLHSMTPPAETETPPPLLHRSPSPLPSNTIPLLIALSFRMLSHHYPPSHLFFFLILHHLFSFCLPPSAPGLSYSTVFCLRVGASHTKPIKLNFRRMTLFHSRYNHRAIVRERSVSMVRSAMASCFFCCFLRVS